MPKRLVYKAQIYPLVAHLLERGLKKDEVLRSIVNATPVDLDVLNSVLAMFKDETRLAA